MSPAGFEPAIPARELPQTDTLDRPATGIGASVFTPPFNNKNIAIVSVAPVEVTLQHK